VKEYKKYEKVKVVIAQRNVLFSEFYCLREKATSKFTFFYNCHICLSVNISMFAYNEINVFSECLIFITHNLTDIPWHFSISFYNFFYIIFNVFFLARTIPLFRPTVYTLVKIIISKIIVSIILRSIF
jgi:hypothetical protein